jgi:hypothetical protein
MNLGVVGMGGVRLCFFSDALPIFTLCGLEVARLAGVR